MFVTTICLMRHGETTWNAEKKIQGRSDIPLNERGISQVEEMLAGIWSTTWDVIYTSPLERGKSTAHMISDPYGVPMYVDEAFIEKSFGDVEGQPYEHVFSTYPDGVYPGAETDEEVVARVLDTFERIAQKHPGKHILVVTHGAVIHAMLSHFQAIPDGLEHIILKQLCMNTFIYDKSSWTVRTYNKLPGE